MVIGPNNFKSILPLILRYFGFQCPKNQILTNNYHNFFILMVSKIFDLLVVLDKLVGPGSRPVLFIKNISAAYFWASG